MIKGIKARDEKTAELIYRKVYPGVRNFVLKHKGCVADAEDVFQEALFITYKKVQNSEFNMKYSLIKYLDKICRNLWYKELQRRKYWNISYYTNNDLMYEISFDNETEKEFISIYLKNIKKLSENCQKILILHFEKRGIEEIKDIMGYKSRNSEPYKKYRCKKQLIENILSDPEFKKLQNELFSVYRKIFNG